MKTFVMFVVILSVSVVPVFAIDNGDDIQDDPTNGPEQIGVCHFVPWTPPSINIDEPWYVWTDPGDTGPIPGHQWVCVELSCGTLCVKVPICPLP